MIKAIVIRTDGSVNETTTDWEYTKINKEVGGFIEVVTFGDKPYFGYINEEGKMKDLPENEIATKLWYNSGQRILLGDYLAGNVVIFGDIDEDGNDTSAPDDVLADIEKIK